MNEREKLINAFTGEPLGLYVQMKACIKDCNPRIDEWFQGCINSLYYKPNRCLLILEGDLSLCRSFIIRLLPNELEMFSECWYVPFEWKRFIVSYDFDSYHSRFKKLNRMVQSDGFRIMQEGSDRRLVSYSTIVHKMEYPLRKCNIVIKLNEETFDLERYKSIDKNLLWQDIFSIYGRKK